MNFNEIHNCAQCGHRETPNKKPKTIEKWLCFFGIFPFFLVPPLAHLLDTVCRLVLA